MFSLFRLMFFYFKRGKQVMVLLHLETDKVLGFIIRQFSIGPLKQNFIAKPIGLFLVKMVGLACIEYVEKYV